MRLDKKVKETFDKKVVQVYERLEKLGYSKERILGVFLYGSQNYSLHTENSDFDFKVIVFPRVNDLLFKREISKTYQLVDDGSVEDQIEVKDIQKMMEMWKKGNPAYLEILDTQYFHTNYPEAIIELRSFKPATMNNISTVNAIYGMATQKQYALCHPYPSKKDIIEKYGYDSKQLTHILRLAYILTEMEKEYSENNNKDFNINDYALNMPQNFIEYLLKVKGYSLSLEEAKELADRIILQMKKTKHDLTDSKRREIGALDFNANIWNQMNDWMVYNLRMNLKKELTEG